MFRDRWFELFVTQREFCMAPFRCVVSLKRPIFNCWLGFTRSCRVGCFVFQPDRRSTETFFSVASTIDTVLMARYRDQLGAQVKFTFLGLCGERMKVVVGLDTFFQDLTTLGLVQVGRWIILRLVPNAIEKLHMKRQEQTECMDIPEVRKAAPSLDPNNVPYSITNNVRLNFKSKL